MIKQKNEYVDNKSQVSHYCNKYLQTDQVKARENPEVLDWNWKHRYEFIVLKNINTDTGITTDIRIYGVCVQKCMHMYCWGSENDYGMLIL